MVPLESSTAFSGVNTLPFSLLIGLDVPWMNSGERNRRIPKKKGDKRKFGFQFLKKSPVVTIWNVGRCVFMCIL